jgi:ribosomal-protein-alanine N-acetyltransferase
MRAEITVEDAFGNLPDLETDRLVLRKLTLEDVDDILAYASEPEDSRYTTWYPHASPEDSRSFLQAVQALYDNREVAPWGIVVKSEGKIVGTCGFANWVPRHARAEVAYALARHHWGKGYMTEAVREVLRFGFAVIQLYRAEARCDVENVGSYRVMEKAGMAYEGVLRGQMHAKGAFVDLKMYAILRPEWVKHTASAVVIGRATGADVEGIRRVAAIGWRTTYRDIYTAEHVADFIDRAYSLEGLTRSVNRPQQVFLVAKDGRWVVGFCHFGPSEAGFQLYRMYVVPAYWRVGIGARFMALMEAHLRGLGAADYHCYVQERNEIGKAFYRKAGFVREASRDQGDEWCMVKRLA